MGEARNPTHDRRPQQYSTYDFCNNARLSDLGEWEVENATENDNDTSLGSSASALELPRAIERIFTCIMNSMIGFLGSYWEGFAPSMIPPWAVARTMVKELPRAGRWKIRELDEGSELI